MGGGRHHPDFLTSNRDVFEAYGRFAMFSNTWLQKMFFKLRKKEDGCFSIIIIIIFILVKINPQEHGQHEIQ